MKSTLRRNLLFLGVALGLVGAPWALGQALATTMTFTTPGGSMVGGQPVDVTATFITSAGQIQISVVNLQANPTAVIQNLSDLGFVLSNHVTTGALSSSAAELRNVAKAAPHAWSSGGTASTGWNLENTVAFGTPLGTGMRLCVLCAAAGPAHTLLGQPDPAHPADYRGANSSIAGNTAHNPFIYGTVANPVTFTVSASVTTATSVTGVRFSFGTTEGNNIDVCCRNRTPLPGTLLLLGSGLASLAAIGWRRTSGK